MKIILICLTLCAIALSATSVKSKPMSVNSGQTSSGSKQPRSENSIGWATYYTVASSGSITASGKPYKESLFTCALPFKPPVVNGKRKRQWGKLYLVTNRANGKQVIVSHQDLGPGRKARSRNVVIDLTPTVFKALGGKLRDGKMMVQVEEIK